MQEKYAVLHEVSSNIASQREDTIPTYEGTDRSQAMGLVLRTEVE